MSLRSTYSEQTINAVHSDAFHNSELGAGAREGFLVDALADSTSAAALSSA